MPNTKSAKKELRQSAQKRKQNLVYKKKIKDLLKKIDFHLAEKNKEKAQELFPLAYKTLDKMVKRGIIKKNTAARKKSQVAKKLNITD